MNWLLRALGLIREADLTETQRAALAAAREEQTRIDMGLLVLEGLNANTVARTYGVTRDYVTHSAVMALRATPGFTQSRFNALLARPAFGTLKASRHYWLELTVGRSV